MKTTELKKIIDAHDNTRCKSCQEVIRKLLSDFGYRVEFTWQHDDACTIKSAYKMRNKELILVYRR